MVQLGEGAALLEFDKVSSNKIQSLCDRLEGFGAGPKVGMKDVVENKLLVVMLAMASKYDRFAEKLIDRHMCTDICPCYSAGEEWMKNENDVKIKRIDPEYTYGLISEELLNLHNRTMLNKTAYIPMVFSANQNESFNSFYECEASWIEKAKKDTKINLRDVFEMEFVPKNGRDMKKNVVKDGFMMLEMDFFEHIESEYDCSGMCETSLFYYTKNVAEGVPDETCLMHVKNNIGDNVRSYGQLSFFSAIISFGLFFVHFFLYTRKELTDEQVVEE